MKLVTAVLLSVLLTKACAHVAHKRNVAQFGLMVLRFTRRNPFVFHGYGCWCGVGGRGVPVDRLDQCCQVHDRCYDAVRRMGCRKPNWDFYNWSRYGCNTHTFVSKNDGCEQATCVCDWNAAICLARSPYNYQFAPGWSHSTC